MRDLAPLAVLHHVEALHVEGLRGPVDAAPIAQMRAVTDLDLGGNWMTPRNVRLRAIAFLLEMPQLKRLLLTTLIVDDLDYTRLLSLPHLKEVAVMKAGGMTPPHEDLVKRLPWLA